MRALVTGGNRYIGLELVRQLASAGDEVTVVNSHVVDLPEGVRRLHADRRIPGEFDKVLGPHRDEFDVVFDNTAFTIDDVEPMVRLFDGRVGHYVFTSSTAVYRRSFVQPIREDARRHAPGDEDPRKAYGVGKVRCEDLLMGQCERSGFPASVVRISHTLGPRSPLVTRDPIFFARLEQGRPIFVPGEGFAMLSLIHIADAAAAMRAVGTTDVSVGRAYNVAGSEVTSILGAIHLMARSVGVDAQVVHVPPDIARGRTPPLIHWGEALTGSAVFAIDAALRDLDWRPRFGIEDGYQDSYGWFCAGGREQYVYDFSADDEVFAAIR